MQQSLTAVVERNVTFDAAFATEPYEAGWADEARWFVRVLEAAGEGAELLLHPQISPDGLFWCDEGSASAGWRMALASIPARCATSAAGCACAGKCMGNRRPSRWSSPWRSRDKREMCCMDSSSVTPIIDTAVHLWDAATYHRMHGDWLDARPELKRSWLPADLEPELAAMRRAPGRHHRGRARPP